MLLIAVVLLIAVYNTTIRPMKKLIIPLVLVVIMLIILIFQVFGSTEPAKKTSLEIMQPDKTKVEPQPEPTPQPEPEPIPESVVEPQSAEGLPANWDSLTSRQKTSLNPFNCDQATQWVSAAAGRCINKPIPEPQPEPTPQPEPEPLQEPEPIPEPVVEPEPLQEPEPEPPRRRRRRPPPQRPECVIDTDTHICIGQDLLNYVLEKPPALVNVAFCLEYQAKLGDVVISPEAVYIGITQADFEIAVADCATETLRQGVLLHECLAELGDIPGAAEECDVLLNTTPACLTQDTLQDCRDLAEKIKECQAMVEAALNNGELEFTQFQAEFDACATVE